MATTTINGYLVDRSGCCRVEVHDTRCGSLMFDVDVITTSDPWTAFGYHPWDAEEEISGCLVEVAGPCYKFAFVVDENCPIEYGSNCGFCAGATPKFAQLTFNGVQPCSSARCVVAQIAQLNGSHILQQHPSYPCIWLVYEAVTDCAAIQINAALLYSGAYYWSLGAQVVAQNFMFDAQQGVSVPITCLGYTLGPLNNTWNAGDCGLPPHHSIGYGGTVSLLLGV